MRVKIEDLRKSIRFSKSVYSKYYDIAKKTIDFRHNRQYTVEEFDRIVKRNQVPQTYNIIGKYTNLILGHITSYVNNVYCKPVQYEDNTIALVMNKIFDQIREKNNFEGLKNRILEQALLTGLFLMYINVIETGEKDYFGRPIREVKTEFVPYNEIFLDPQSRNPDYSDAEFVHRVLWLPERKIKKMISGLGEDLKTNFKKRFKGTDVFSFFQKDKYENINYNEEVDEDNKNYQLVHSVIQDGNKDTYSVYWIEDKIIYKEKLTFESLKFPYLVYKLKTDVENISFTGVFNDVLDKQVAINQSLIKLDFLSNSIKVIYEGDALFSGSSEEKFIDDYQKLSSFVKVNSIDKIKEVDNRAALSEQRSIYNDKLMEVMQILGINDSFLGIANASDSGVKVNTQKRATLTHLQYLVQSLDNFFIVLGRAMLNLVKQYYTAEQVIEITDEREGNISVAINSPEIEEVRDANGNVSVIPKTSFKYNEKTGSFYRDEKGNLIAFPVIQEGTDLSVSKLDVYLKPTKDKEEEMEQVNKLLEIILSPIGQTLSTINPAGYMKIGSIIALKLGGDNGEEVYKIFRDTAFKLDKGERQTPYNEEQQKVQSELSGLGNVYTSKVSKES